MDHVEASASRGRRSPFNDFPGGGGSLSGACTCNRLGAEIDVRHDVLFRFLKLVAHAYVHAILRDSTVELLLAERPDLVVLN